MGRATFVQMHDSPKELEDAFEGTELAGMPVSGVYRTWLWSPVYAYDMATYMRVAARQYEASKLPWREGRQVFAEIEREVTDLVFTILTKMLAPVYGRATQDRDRSLTRNQLCRIALETKAYKGSNGAYPDNLDELQRHLAWDIPLDVFSGKPLLYRIQGEGFVLYSVGPDGIDNGGIDGPGDDWQGVDIVWSSAR
jgi:hypothetical protein